MLLPGKLPGVFRSPVSEDPVVQRWKMEVSGQKSGEKEVKQEMKDFRDGSDFEIDYHIATKSFRILDKRDNKFYSISKICLLEHLGFSIEEAIYDD